MVFLRLIRPFLQIYTICMSYSSLIFHRRATLRVAFTGVIGILINIYLPTAGGIGGGWLCLGIPPSIRPVLFF